MQKFQQNNLWDYQIIENIGQGEYGIVYKVKTKKSQEIFALKKININSLSQQEKLDCYREIKMIKKCEHPNLLKYYESFLSVDNLYIVMQYAEKGDLLHHINQRRAQNNRFKQQELWALFKQLSSALKALHDKKIIHRDIKLQNIFLTKTNQIKLGDLGLSKILTQRTNYQISQRVGTPLYFAPEIILHKNYSFQIDVWALGCVFYYLTALQHPFQGATLQNLGQVVLEKGPKSIRSHYSAKIIKVIHQMMQKHPNNRATIDEVIKMIKEHQNSKTYNKISIYNKRYLNNIRAEIKNLSETKNISQNQELSQLYQKMKITGQKIDNPEYQPNYQSKQQVLNQHSNHFKLGDLLQNVLKKKFSDIQIQTQSKSRRKRNDSQGYDIQLEAIRHSSMNKSIRSNGFQILNEDIPKNVQRYGNELDEVKKRQSSKSVIKKRILSNHIKPLIKQIQQ